MKTAMISNKLNTLPNREPNDLLKLQIPTPTDDDDERNTRSPIFVPLKYESFASSFFTKYREGAFLGRESHGEKSNQRRQFRQIYCVAKSELLKTMQELEPTPQALERTKRAAKDFFSLSYQLLDKLNMESPLAERKFPLAGRNKCMGMVAVPKTKVVTIAISQDKDPTNDEQLRTEMIHFLAQLNLTSETWIFELACVPTKSQYLLPRTLSVRVPQAAPESSVAPRTRCVEVALMAALCKAGRTIDFNSADTGIIAFGPVLWASPDGAEAITHFGCEKRNKKYTEQAPLEVDIAKNIKGYVDIWEPCPEHCKIYKYEMLAIGASGGFSTSFFEPRSEGLLLGKSPMNVKGQNVSENDAINTSLEGITRSRSFSF